MSPTAPSTVPERRETDESLRTERKKTDQVIARSHEGSESSADQLLEKTRDKADAVLERAREGAAEDVVKASTSADQRAALERSRKVEDAALQMERDAADAVLRRQREDDSATLAALLPLEREKTDRHLLTERARSDAAIANRDDFLGMVSHDLRNLLSAVALTASTVSKRSHAEAPAPEDGRRTADDMAKVRRYVARMNRLIGDLVDVASIDAGKLSISRERCDVAALLGEAIEHFAAAAAEKGVALELVAEERPLFGDVDRERVLQLLANLIANAIKFTPAGGRVVVSGRHLGKKALSVSVKDNGIGIPPHLLEVVFERFWQAGKDDRRGIGLGLYISRSIVEAHGGTIRAESEPGRGTTLTFTLPLADT